MSPRAASALSGASAFGNASLEAGEFSGITRFELDLVDPYEDSPYVNIKAFSGSHEVNVVQMLRRFVAHLGYG